MTVQRYHVALGLRMSALLLAVLGVSTEYCSVWREIQPCSCNLRRTNDSQIIATIIMCEKMESFAQIVRILDNKFSATDRVSLRINNSKLDDLEYRYFKEMNMTIIEIKLNYNNLRDLKPYSFTGLVHVGYFAFTDNLLPYIPTEILEKMPNIKTLDLGRLKIRALHEGDLSVLANLQNLVLAGNSIQRMDTNSIPSTVKKLHIGRNKLHDLNGTLVHLSQLEWLFINSNELTSLENQLPRNGQKLKMIFAFDNLIRKLPNDFKYLTYLQDLYLHNNSISTLDGVLSRLRNLERLHLQDNEIIMLQDDDFSEATKLQTLNLGYNKLTSLNNSIRPLINLSTLNVSHNLIEQFSFEEIRGVIKLTVLDISYNRINHLTGFTTNVIDWESNLRHLRMDHNEIFSLNSSVSGFRNLVRLYVSYNKLTKILPDDLIGLDRLNMLDISHNHLLTLEETSQTFLPSLQELLASYNNLTVLDRDFHGLPVLCWADLSHNNISLIGRDLVSKTHCRVHDGIHSDIWGVLKIDLADNPILCDLALPEILSAMEINHTKISGSANCPTLSEQPVTTKRTNFFGYLGPETTSSLPPIYNIPHLNEPININPLYNGVYRSIADTSNQLKKSVDDLSVHDSNNHQNQIQGDQPQMDYGINLQSSANIFVPLSEQYNSEYNAETASIHNRETIPYQHSIYLSNQDEKVDTNNNYPDSITANHKPLNDQLAYSHYDQTIQEQQISKLTSEIEELRVRVQKLTSENERLAYNLNHNLQSTNKVFANTRPILPSEQVPTLTTIKPPNTNIESTP